MKALHVIRREYVENARKKSFIVSTIVAPVLVAFFYAIPVATMLLIPPEQVSVAVLDRTGLFAEDFVSSLSDSSESGKNPYKAMVADPRDRDPDQFKKVLIESIDSNALDILIEIPEDVLDRGVVGYISKDHFDERLKEDIKERLDSIVVAKRLEKAGLDYDRVSALTQRMRLNEQKITKRGLLEGRQVVGQFATVAAFVMILYVTLFTWGIAVQRSIIEEKGSRAIEVMLSSVEPRDLFVGKIVGLGALGLTQIVIWGLILFAVGASSTVAFAEFSQYVRVSPSDVAYFVVFFVLGFLLFSSLFTIVGAVCSTEQDAQQLHSVIVLPMMIPVMLLLFVIQNPSSTASTVLSIVPFFAPLLMLARVVISDPEAWEIALTIVLLVASIYGVIIVSSRIFRVGILMYGKRPSLREIFRWSRYA